MRKIFLALLLGAAFLPACNTPFEPLPRSRIQLAQPDPPVYTGSPAMVVEVHGTARNTGTVLARDITVTAQVGQHVLSKKTNPSDLAPGEVATWSLKLAGNQAPSLSVTWR